MKRLVAVVLVCAMVASTLGCASMTEEQKGAAVGAGLGAAIGTGLGYALGGSQGAVIGGSLGLAAGALTGWAIAKKQQAAKQAALANKTVEIVKEDKTERVVADPPVGYEVKNNVKYAKVRTRTYKTDPKTQKEEMTSDTYERVALE